MRSLDGLSIRALQAFAGEIFRGYCQARGLVHAEIDKLVDHTWDLLWFPNETIWSEEFPGLGEVGQGDPFDPSFERILVEAKEDPGQFRLLLEWLTEISQHCLYAAVDIQYAQQCVKNISRIAERQGVALPSADILRSNREAVSGGWGQPMQRQLARRVQELYKSQ